MVKQGESVYFQLWEWEDGRGYIVNLFLVIEEDHRGWSSLPTALRRRQKAWLLYWAFSCLPLTKAHTAISR